MKRLCTCLLAVLVLSSCTPVEDFGPYWDKGFVDPALEGSWKKLGPPNGDIKSVPGPDVWRFTKNGSSFSQQAIYPINPTAAPDVIEQQKEANEHPLIARTLRIGNHQFLMQRTPGGDATGFIVRYDVRRGTLTEYWMDNDVALAFLQSKHPTAKNIGKNVGEGEFVVIGTFDDEVFRVLSEIADDPAYWILNRRYQKIQ